jgi:hypothetical protein
MTSNRLTEEAWDRSLVDFRATTLETFAAEVVRTTLIGAAGLFYLKHLVPRGFPPFSERALSNMLVLRGELPEAFGKLIDNALIAGYHSLRDPNTQGHVAAVDHLRESLHSLKDSLLKAAHLKKSANSHA